MTIETIQTVPLSFWKDGTIRIKGTRLLLDMIVGAHNRGECPEEIFESFPSDEYTVADIYLVIAYYLSHKAKIDKHLAQRTKKAEAIWKQIESDPKNIVTPSQLRKYKALRKTE